MGTPVVEAIETNTEETIEVGIPWFDLEIRVDGVTRFAISVREKSLSVYVRDPEYKGDPRIIVRDGGYGKQLKMER
jgi:hypothetical protein